MDSKETIVTTTGTTIENYLEWIFIGCPEMPNVIELILEPDDLNAQPIIVITNKIKNLKNLKEIHFVDIDITELPLSIVTLTKLQSIKIHNTSLESLPENIGNLKNLKYLELKQCHIESLPPSIVQLNNLLNLDFENTPLEELPPNIGQLTKLQILNLAGTNIDSLPPSIGNLKKLQILNLTGTGVETLPETLKNIRHTLGIAINNTPIISNPAYVLQLRSWPSNFKIKPLPRPPEPEPAQALAPEPLASVRMQVNPYLKAQDIININNNDTAQQFLNLNEGYKIFICNGLYYATSYNLLSSYINNPTNEYYICNRLTNGGFQRTNTNPLISIKIIMSFHGFVKKSQLLTALNSPNNYFELSEQGENVAVIQGRLNSNVFSTCQEANAKLYEINAIDVIDRTELISNVNNKTDYSDIFKDVESENEDNKFNIFKDVESENEDNARGGKTRRVRKCVKNSTRRFRKSRKCVKNSTSRFRKSRRR
jgi:Leucine-rich repeat (LRR) protein